MCVCVEMCCFQAVPDILSESVNCFPSQQLDKAHRELHAKDTENDTLSRQIQHLLQQTTRRAQGGALVSCHSVL